MPPHFCYLSQCSGRLNPNLYDNGKVCVSLLGTWIGKVSTVPVRMGDSPWGQLFETELIMPCVFQGTERWTSKSSLLQVLISIQGTVGVARGGPPEGTQLPWCPPLPVGLAIPGG